jgi:hypothetical protein
MPVAPIKKISEQQYLFALCAASVLRGGNVVDAGCLVDCSVRIVTATDNLVMWFSD